MSKTKWRAWHRPFKLGDFVLAIRRNPDGDKKGFKKQAFWVVRFQAELKSQGLRWSYAVRMSAHEHRWQAQDAAETKYPPDFTIYNAARPGGVVMTEEDYVMNKLAELAR